MNRPVLRPDEKRIFDVIADVSEEWSNKPRSEERAGAKVALGAVLGRLGWLTLYLDEAERREKRNR